MRIWWLTLLYLAGPGLAWAWYHLGTRPPALRQALRPRPAIPGYTFEPRPVGAAAIEILATTNLFNGAFRRGDESFAVFAADWRAETAREMSVVQHTPDICWVGAGFRVLEMGQPRAVTIPISGTPVPFECRVFQAPGQGAAPPEMTVWTTLVGGRFLEEGFRFDAGSATNQPGGPTSLERARLRGANMFLRALRLREPSNGSKQFVRFSLPIREDWPSTLRAIEAFAPLWLDLQQRLDGTPAGDR